MELYKSRTQNELRSLLSWAFTDTPWLFFAGDRYQPSRDYIQLPYGSSVGALETITHDMGHIIDCVVRGQCERLELVDFGFNMPEQMSANAILNALKCETRVMAYQWGILQTVGYTDIIEFEQNLLKSFEHIFYYHPESSKVKIRRFVSGHFHKNIVLLTEDVKIIWKQFVDKMNEKFQVGLTN